MAWSFRPPWGSLLVGRAPLYAWGKAPGLPDVVPVPEPLDWEVPALVDFSGHLLVHQVRLPTADLAMKFAPETFEAFPRNYLLGVVRVKAVLPPSTAVDSDWAEEGEWHFRVDRPRAFSEPIAWRFERGLFSVDHRAVRLAVERVEIEQLRVDNGPLAASERV